MSTLLDAAKTLSTIFFNRDEPNRFAKWLKEKCIQEGDYFKYKPHNNYPYTLNQLFEMFKKEDKYESEW